MKKFLTTFAGIAAAFGANAAFESSPTNITTDSKTVVVKPGSTLGETIATTNAQGDRLNFVLKKSEETGQLMAWHSSHSSHASHSSHRSHYSSR